MDAKRRTNLRRQRQRVMPGNVANVTSLEPSDENLQRKIANLETVELQEDQHSEWSLLAAQKRQEESRARNRINKTSEFVPDRTEFRPPTIDETRNITGAVSLMQSVRTRSQARAEYSASLAGSSADDLMDTDVTHDENRNSSSTEKNKSRNASRKSARQSMNNRSSQRAAAESDATMRCEETITASQGQDESRKSNHQQSSAASSATCAAFGSNSFESLSSCNPNESSFINHEFKFHSTRIQPPLGTNTDVSSIDVTQDIEPALKQDANQDGEAIQVPQVVVEESAKEKSTTRRKSQSLKRSSAVAETNTSPQHDNTRGQSEAPAAIDLRPEAAKSADATLIADDGNKEQQPEEAQSPILHKRGNKSYSKSRSRVETDATNVATSNEAQPQASDPEQIEVQNVEEDQEEVPQEAERIINSAVGKMSRTDSLLKRTLLRNSFLMADAVVSPKQETAPTRKANRTETNRQLKAAKSKITSSKSATDGDNSRRQSKSKLKRRSQNRDEVILLSDAAPAPATAGLSSAPAPAEPAPASTDAPAVSAPASSTSVAAVAEIQSDNVESTNVNKTITLLKEMSHSEVQTDFPVDTNVVLDAVDCYSEALHDGERDSAAIEKQRRCASVGALSLPRGSLMGDGQDRWSIGIQKYKRYTMGMTQNESVQTSFDAILGGKRSVAMQTYVNYVTVQNTCNVSTSMTGRPRSGDTASHVDLETPVKQVAALESDAPTSKNHRSSCIVDAVEQQQQQDQQQQAVDAPSVSDSIVVLHCARNAPTRGKTDEVKAVDRSETLLAGNALEIDNCDAFGSGNREPLNSTPAHQHGGRIDEPHLDRSAVMQEDEDADLSCEIPTIPSGLVSIAAPPSRLNSIAYQHFDLASSRTTNSQLPQAGSARLVDYEITRDFNSMAMPAPAKPFQVPALPVKSKAVEKQTAKSGGSRQQPVEVAKHTEAAASNSADTRTAAQPLSGEAAQAGVALETVPKTKTEGDNQRRSNLIKEIVRRRTLLLQRNLDTSTLSTDESRELAVLANRRYKERCANKLKKTARLTIARQSPMRLSVSTSVESNTDSIEARRLSKSFAVDTTISSSFSIMPRSTSTSMFTAPAQTVIIDSESDASFVNMSGKHREVATSMTVNYEGVCDPFDLTYVDDAINKPTSTVSTTSIASNGQRAQSDDGYRPTATFASSAAPEQVSFAADDVGGSYNWPADDIRDAATKRVRFAACAADSESGRYETANRYRGAVRFGGNDDSYQDVRDVAPEPSLLNNTFGLNDSTFNGLALPENATRPGERRAAVGGLTLMHTRLKLDMRKIISRCRRWDVYFRDRIAASKYESGSDRQYTPNVRRSRRNRVTCRLAPHERLIYRRDSYGFPVLAGVEARPDPPSPTPRGVWREIEYEGERELLREQRATDRRHRAAQLRRRFLSGLNDSSNQSASLRNASQDDGSLASASSERPRNRVNFSTSRDEDESTVTQRGKSRSEAARGKSDSEKKKNSNKNQKKKQETTKPKRAEVQERTTRPAKRVNRLPLDDSDDFGF